MNAETNATSHATNNANARAMMQPMESDPVSIVPISLRADCRHQSIPLNAPQVHTLAFCVWNNPGVLQRIAGFFCRRAVALRELSFKEESGPRFDVRPDPVGSPGMARVYLSFKGSDALRRQLVGQIEKMLDAVPLHADGSAEHVHANQGEDGK